MKWDELNKTTDNGDTIVVTTESGKFVVKNTNKDKILYAGSLADCRDWLDFQENLVHRRKLN